jgi:Uma2 family endonuclease
MHTAMTVELTPTPPRRYTVEEYLAMEEKSEIRHEFVNGKLISMAGASANHHDISGNVFAFLHSALRGRACRAYHNDAKVLIKPANSYRYPDVFVACNPQTAPERSLTVLNPTVIFEVLSDSTESIDMNDKLKEYTSIESMRQYILLSQNDRRAIVYTRVDTSSPWTLSFVDGQGKLELPSLVLSLSMDDVYAGVVFEDKETQR